MYLLQGMMPGQSLFQLLKAAGLVTLGQADIAVLCHVLHRAQVFFFQPLDKSRFA